MISTSACLLYAGACGPIIGTDESTDPGNFGSTGAGATSTGSVENSSLGTGTIPPTTGTTAAGEATTRESTAGDTTAGESACMPGPVNGGIACEEPGNTIATFEILGVDSLDSPLALSCTLVEQQDDGETQTLALDCASEGEVTLAMQTAEPHMPITSVEPGATYQLDIVRQWFGEIGPDEFFVLRDQSELLLAVGVDGESLPDVELIDWSPLEITNTSTDCPSHVAGECMVVQDSALEVTFSGNTAAVSSGHVGYVGPLVSYGILADNVERVVCWPDDCGINYASWSVRALMVLIPEG